MRTAALFAAAFVVIALTSPTPAASKSREDDYGSGGTVVLDAEGCVGSMVAASLGHERRVAWDIDLFYDGEAEWTSEELPRPFDWMRQLGWTDPDRLRAGEDLLVGLRSAMERFNAREM